MDYLHLAVSNARDEFRPVTRIARIDRDDEIHANAPRTIECRACPSVMDKHDWNTEHTAIWYHCRNGECPLKWIDLPRGDK